MTRVTPLRREDHPDLDEKFFTPYEQTRGYVPNSNLVMARRPKLLAAFRALNAAVFDQDNTVPRGCWRWSAISRARRRAVSIASPTPRTMPV